MVNEAPSLNPEYTIRQGTSRDTLPHLYWKKRDGWVVVATSAPVEWQNRVERGHTPLSQYGLFVFGQEIRDERGVPFNARQEPWRILFQRGGAHEFPLEQVLAYHWHIRPPYREVTFPQLEGVEYEVFECPECERAVFTSLNIGFAPQVLATHLRLGHGWSRAEINEYAREMQITFKRQRHVRSSGRPREVKHIGEATTALERDQSHKCTICGWAPLADNKRPDFALMGHTRMKHKAARKGVSEGE